MRPLVRDGRFGAGNTRYTPNVPTISARQRNRAIYNCSRSNAFETFLIPWELSRGESRGGVRAHHDTQRGIFAVWGEVVQEKRAHSYRQTKPPLQGVWS